MPIGYTFGVIGGDKRMQYLASSIAADGYPVYVTGLEKLGECRGAASVSLAELTARSTVIVLPLPAARDGKTLNAPYSEKTILLDDAFIECLHNKTVYGGMLQNVVTGSAKWQQVGPEDYYRREELTVGNAILTAEGALLVAIREFPEI